MPPLKARLRSDLNQAMKSRDELRTATLRMTLAAITTEEVAGAAARELSDDEVQRVITRETRKRREAADAFDQGGRAELAARERAEGAVLEGYLPKQLGDAELADLVRAAVIEANATEPRELGAVMKLVQPRVAGRADGRRVSDEVRRQLSSRHLARPPAKLTAAPPPARPSAELTIPAGAGTAWDWEDAEYSARARARVQSRGAAVPAGYSSAEAQVTVEVVAAAARKAADRCSSRP